jgi:hypothetical protein
MNPNKKARK